MVGAVQASKYYDEATVVTGKVISQFGDLQKLQGQNEEISGTVTEYRNKPEIILESPSQIKVSGGQWNWN